MRNKNISKKFLNKEKQFYVRTTYGIGKVVRIGISYTDDNYLWMIDLITDNRDICISIIPNESIKTKNKELFEELNRYNHKYLDMVLKNNDLEIICYKPWISRDKEYNPFEFYPRGNCELFNDHTLLKSDKLLLKLIDDDDIINGREIQYICNDCLVLLDDYDYEKEEYNKIYEEDIKTIITKEKLEKETYEVNKYE